MRLSLRVYRFAELLRVPSKPNKNHWTNEKRKCRDCEVGLVENVDSKVLTKVTAVFENVAPNVYSLKVANCSPDSDVQRYTFSAFIVRAIQFLSRADD